MQTQQPQQHQSTDPESQSSGHPFFKHYQFGSPRRRAGSYALAAIMGAVLGSSIASSLTSYSFAKLASARSSPAKTGSSWPQGRLKLDQVNTLLSAATQGQAVAYASFAGPDGLTGALVGDANPSAPSAQQRVISWVSPSGYVMTGSLLAPDGANWTLGAIQAFGSRGVNVSNAGDGSATAITPGKQPSLTAQAQPTASSDGSIQAGGVPSGLSTIKQAAKPGSPELTVFFDPNCVFCHVMWQNLNSAQIAGKIRIHWVPVGILRADSMPRAASLIAGGMQALNANEVGFNGGAEAGAAPLSSNKADIQAAAQNTQKFLEWTQANHLSPTTPILVWKSSDGQTRAVAGAQTVEWVSHSILPR